MNQPYKEIDKKLKQTRKKYNEIYEDLYSDLIPYFDEFNIVGDIILPREDKKALKRKYTRHKWINDLAKLYAVYYVSKPILKQSDKLFLQILENIDKEYEKCDNINVGLMQDIAEIGYENCLEDIDKKTMKTKVKKYEDKDYLNARVIADTNKLVIRAKLKAQKEEIKRTLEKQENEWVSTKDNKFSGHLEVETEKAYNNGYLQACKDYGINQVRFIAVMDDRTTTMCESLDMQVFNINDYNTFTRYYDSAKKEETTTVFGMVEGINCPPITDHFHYCRSYLEAIKNN